MSQLIRLIDGLAALVGKTGALVLPLLMLTILVNVFLRYVLDIGMIELEELQWHLNAVTVMTSLAWAYQQNDHVRVDMFHAKFSLRKQAIVEILGVLFLFLPFTALIAWHSWTIFSFSWALKEGSPMPSGLPARYIIKGIMAFGLSLLVLQGVSILLKSVKRLGVTG
jgi:TRAP-type mannitol/chloroaromatic compound transport system permease small subunit